MAGRRGKIRRFAPYVIFAGLAVGGFALFGPPQLLHKSETPQFCAGCHVMTREYEALMRPGPHTRLKCIDCHLPNDNIVNHFVWKGIDGGKDLIFFYSGLVPDPIEASVHAKETVKANCETCHDEMISRIDTEDRYCWDCHRGLLHEKSGMLEGSIAAQDGR